jgi:peptidoglycan/xylan/chitin deacetylase (PgdA/CDA1 family)
MKPCASVSLDLDNKWSYLKTHGDAEWSAYPSYLDRVVPRILDRLGAHDLKITFFIVGKDAAIEGNRASFRAIADAGHEIASHSFNHDPWLHLYTEAQLEEELEEAEAAILAATGARPTGFRGPGFSLSPATLSALAKRGYAYDATVFPNVLNPLARAYFFWRSNLSREEKRRRSALFGSWREALKPVKPFKWDVAGRSLTEIPVTTMPIFRIPIHLSYVIYLSRFSRRLALWYFWLGVSLCRLTSTAPSILLHPLDFLGCEDDGDLRFFPGMDLDARYKMDIVDRALDMLARHYRLVPVGEHVQSIAAEKLTRVLRPEPVDRVSVGVGP